MNRSVAVLAGLVLLAATAAPALARGPAFPDLPPLPEYPGYVQPPHALHPPQATQAPYRPQPSYTPSAPSASYAAPQRTAPSRSLTRQQPYPERAGYASPASYSSRGVYPEAYPAAGGYDFEPYDAYESFVALPGCCGKVCYANGPRKSCASYTTVLLVCHPCTGCKMPVEVCLPACCTGEPDIRCRRTVFGCGQTKYTWCCGYGVVLRFKKCGDVVVHYF